MNFWNGKRVTVTGGAGFLGSFVVRRLKEEGADVFVVHSRDYDLIQRKTTTQLYAAARPELLIHLAARVGGIGANRENPDRCPKRRCDLRPAPEPPRTCESAPGSHVRSADQNYRRGRTDWPG